MSAKRIPRVLTAPPAILVALVSLAACAGLGPGGITGMLEPVPAPPEGAYMCAKTAIAGPGHRDIGPQGDSIQAGRHRLVVPAGAVAQGQRVRFEFAEPPASYIVVQARRQSAQLNRPVRITMTTARCDRDVTTPTGVLRYGPGTANQWQPVDSSRLSITRDPEGRAHRVDVEVDDFSSYVLVAPQ